MVDSDEQYKIKSGNIFKRRKNRLLNEKNEMKQQDTDEKNNEQEELVVRNQILKY